jgi:opacity protein-like surface antigen
LYYFPYQRAQNLNLKMKRKKVRKIKRLLVTVAFALVFVTDSAQAADQGMYLSGSFGSSILLDADNSSPSPSLGNTEFDYDLGANISGAVGYNFGNARAEGELTYHRNGVDRFLTTTNTLPSDGTISALSFIVNGYYDFHSENSSLAPYLGGGIGFASIDLEVANIGIAQIIDDRTTVFAYQLMAGFGLNINPTTTLTAGYRYFVAADPEFNAVNGIPFESKYQSHEIIFGARFAF